MKKELVEFLIKVNATTGGAAASLKSLVGPAVAATAAAVAAGVAFKAMADGFAASVDSVLTFSAQTGASVAMINGLKLAARSTGKDMKELIPKDMAKRIHQTAMGTGEAMRGFQSLGLAADIQSGKLKSTDEVYRAVIERLYQIEDPTERAGVAFETLGKQGTLLLSTFGDVGDLDAFIETAGRLTPITEEAMRGMQDWQVAMSNWDLAIEMATSRAGPLISVVSEMVDVFTLGTVAVGGFVTHLATFEGAFTNPVEGFRRMSESIGVGITALHEYQDATKDLTAELRNVADAAESVSYGPSPTMIDDAIKVRLAKEKKLAADLAALAKAARTREIAEAKAHGEALHHAMAIAAFDDGKVLLKFTADIVADLDPAFAELTEAMDGVVKALDDAVIAENNRVAAEQAAFDAQRSEDAARMADPTGAQAFGETLDKELAGLLGPIAMIADIPGFMGSIADLIENLPEAIAAIPLQIVGMLDAFADMPGEMVDMLPQLLVESMDAALRVFLAMVGLEPLVKGLEIIFNLLPGAIADAIAEALGDVIGELNPFDGDGAFLGTNLAAEKGERTLFGMQIPSFDTGGEVAATGLAYVHEKEKVLSVAERRMPGSEGRPVPQVPRVIIEDRRSKGLYGLSVSPGR